MSNKPKGVLYIGVTDNLDERVKEHKLKVYPQSFTVSDKLVYFDKFENGEAAVKREKQMKRWKRDWKIRLIEGFNPDWVDISLNCKFNYNKLR